MSPRKRAPVAQKAYNEIAEAFARRVDTKPHNAYYERPATLSLLPDVNHLRVLDAGCGPGVYAEWLVDHGAGVIAVDGNGKMVRLAKQRLGGKARVLQANLEYPLDFLADASFDIVLSPLVMDYLPDWTIALTEFYRVLKNPGLLVFSISHPFEEFDLHRQTSNYFKTERVEYMSTGFGKPVPIPSYRRPMGEVINPLLKAGFFLDQILEPLPTRQFEQANPGDYSHLIKSPGFMCLRAQKR